MESPTGENPGGRPAGAGLPAADAGLPADTGLLAPGWAGDAAAGLVSDRAWAAAMAEAEAALAGAQAELGLIPAPAAQAIIRAAVRLRPGLARLAAGTRSAANPAGTLATMLTEAVAAADPASAAYVHRGATSQDILDSAAMLVCARALAVLAARLRATADGLAGLAARHRDTPMAGRTLTQHGVPTTFGLKAAGWLSLVLDAADRVGAVLDHGLPASLGGAAGTLAASAEYAARSGPPVPGGELALASRFAVRLGLADPPVPWHAARTPVADVAAAACVTAGALGKLAADVLVLGRTEVGEVSEPAGPGRGGSSAMPHKRNPVLAVGIAAAARQIPPLALVLFGAMAAEDERPPGAWQAEWQPLRECLRLLLGAAASAAELSAGLQVHPAAMSRNLSLTGAAVVSERIAAALAPQLGTERARQLAAEIASPADGDGGPPAQRLAAAVAAAGGRLTPGEAADLLDPARYTGAAGPLTDRILARYRSGQARIVQAAPF